MVRRVPVSGSGDVDIQVQAVCSRSTLSPLLRAPHSLFIIYHAGAHPMLVELRIFYHVVSVRLKLNSRHVLSAGSAVGIYSECNRKTCWQGEREMSGHVGREDQHTNLQGAL